MLLELKQYLIEKQVVNLMDLSRHFHCTPEYMRDLLSHWQRKGCVKCFKPSGCGTRCVQCKPEFAETYCWI